MVKKIELNYWEVLLTLMSETHNRAQNSHPKTQSRTFKAALKASSKLHLCKIPFHHMHVHRDLEEQTFYIGVTKHSGGKT